MTRHHRSEIAFSTTWRTLGPFRIGTREAVWGADPLERYGGFADISYDEDQTFPSPLATNATAHWMMQEFEVNSNDRETKVDLSVQYDSVDWEFLRGIYGWAALQYQVWTRGELWSSAESTLKVTIQPTNILEFRVNDEHVFGGDFYAFERAPVVLNVHPGRNIVNVRLIRDVRAMGGQMPPVIEASFHVSVVNDHLSAVSKSIVVPDIVNGRFTSPFASVTLSNQCNSTIIVHKIFAASLNNALRNGEVRVSSGQSRPVVFNLDDADVNDSILHIIVEYSVQEQQQLFQYRTTSELTRRSFDSPHRFTFLHPSGSVSYAILRPPAHSTDTASDSLPVLVALHGAGVEADSDLVRHSFDTAPDLAAWLLFPTGMSPWCGDDWHTWGFADVQAALHAIPDWIIRNNWSGPGVSMDKYLITGHSNGGQGTWFTALHQPDKVLAAAAASGYSSIENYVPFILWNEADPVQNAVLQSARNSFRHELLIENIGHIPILVQHGEEDDNVPAYHSRLMSHLAAQHRSTVKYVELPHKGHWFDGVMTTEAMLDFYKEHLRISKESSKVPESFSFVVSTSNDFGSRYGIIIDQLESADKLARIDVQTVRSMNTTVWHIQTINIRRLHFDYSSLGTETPDAVRIDDSLTPVLSENIKEDTTFVQYDFGKWAQDETEWRGIANRVGRQRGSLDAILHTQGPFQIVYFSEEVYSVAVQTSRNLLQYFNADSELLSAEKYEEACLKEGNIILITTGQNLPPSKLATFPIQLDADNLYLQTGSKSTKRVWKAEDLAGAWLRPLSGERLELVLWGRDLKGLQHAARMAPTLTGAGQPDFIVFEQSAPWKGYAGALALGFFNHDWNISTASYIR